MADSTTISALLNLQNLPGADKSGRQTASSGDLFSSVMQSTASVRAASKPAAVSHRSDTAQNQSPSSKVQQNNPQRFEYNDRNDRVTEAHTGIDSKSSAASSANKPGYHSNAVDSSSQSTVDDSLTPEQEKLLASLPDSQANAIRALPAEDQSTLLSLMLAQGQLNELSPELSALLEGGTVKQLQSLDEILAKFDQVLATAEDGEAALEELKAILARSDLSDDLQNALLAQVQGAEGMAGLRAQVAELAQVAKNLASVLDSAQRSTIAQLKSAVMAGDNPFSQRLADSTGFNNNAAAWQGGETQAQSGESAAIVKLQADNPFAGLLPQAGGEKNRLVSEAAQLHNLFSSRGEGIGDRSSINNVANLAQLTQQVSQASGQVRVPVAQAQVTTSFQSPDWGQAVNQRVVLLAQQGIKTAEIRLDPPDLGPLQVKISINNEQTQVNFTSHHAVVREALDQNAFRLREMLAEQGMTQVDVDVSSEDQPQMAGHEGDSEGEAGGHGGEASQGESEQGSPTVISTVGLLDQYA
ncbi:flagellar hook-length control protein FliK [Gilvimarinus sp. 1_MG-2023]|uniref:flagellar hook-length control protein FliK n=1 Tax=Gilvimarinus sp. 1_MG-2023 TaxID=3062638 RepID=UPI0026E317F0|nr:flagellar hook-length control protein FliK [Gilvimarinus sp. 1_MG-2023]MDO6745958.1 flagellar hook-length control protein FliK [Gilvimarinus sp. 1_MG-2023]